MITPFSNIDKLKDVQISRRDRELLYFAMTLCTVVVLVLAGAAVALTYYGRDAKQVVSFADTLMWIDFGLVVVFVAGTVENRRAAAKTMTPAPPATVVVQAPEPESHEELVEDVQKTKEIVTETAKDVKVIKKKGEKK